MKMRLGSLSQSKLARAITVAVVLAIASFSAASVLSLHLHILPDGRAVVHSHPIKKDRSEGARHHHSDHDYAIISVLAKVLLSDMQGLGWTSLHQHTCSTRLELIVQTAVSFVDTASPNKRGPPAVTFV